MQKKVLELLKKDIPKGKFCEECPFRGSTTVYHGDDHTQFACCLLLGEADSKGLAISDSEQFKFRDNKLSSDTKICGINEKS